MRMLTGALLAVMVLCLAGCGISPPETSLPSMDASQPHQCAPIKFSPEGNYYKSDIQVSLTSDRDARIYYTLDGSDPDETATAYTGTPIQIWRSRTGRTTAATVKAKAYYADGSTSAVQTHTYFCAKDIDRRFTTAVVSITGEPKELTLGPDGVFWGQNYMLRGEQSERQVYLELWNAAGEKLLSQSCGLRIYGGASRSNAVKSVKLYARKRYDPNNGKFTANLFGTLSATGTVIDEYDKLVLRNAGNDYSYAYIRDELCQMLAMDAGFSDYQSVIPAVCFLNGEYYGLFWLHESYCDDYFQKKYPRENTAGEFVVLEGSDTEKSLPGEPDKDACAQEFNEMYQDFSSADLTDGKTYSQLQQLIDVKNYLDLFAFNIYINNKDWPQNNFKCYRYCGKDTTPQTVYDGKWRFLPHDMDYSFWLYQEDAVAADYDNLEEILTPGTLRYSPLFTALMEREDCRYYFRDKIREYACGPLSARNIQKRLNILHRQFHQEMVIFSELQGRSTAEVELHMQKILQFANQRAEYVQSFVEKMLCKYP